MNPLQDIFISYGRLDSRDFSQYLYQRLVEVGYTVWYDFEDIPQGVDYQKQIDDAIAKTDNFVFIISPHATNSAYCRREIERAVALNKRLVPIMHIEQINREIWQQRHPNSSDTDWYAYTAAGKHTYLTNLHPELAKINWNQVTFQEGTDDFEQPFQALLDIFERQKNYVHRHTVLLNKALEWEYYQRQTRYLLIGEERHQAEVWLATQFKTEQPPCIPTDLHCEFITASIKNANNLMTQVFLCHAEEDHKISEQIRRTLMRAGITTWTHQGDIEFGSDFQTAMGRGMEEADNVVFLLSPHSLESVYCRQELDHALSLNKRIIPLLVDPVDTEQLPVSLQNLQYIDLTDNLTKLDYRQDEKDLLRILKRDAAYYNEHKILLTKALKWERQQHNPCILLRGYELQHAQAWLKLAGEYPHHGPISLQTEFITESERQPSGISLDVFVSYSRTDSDFARKLNDGLQRQGKRTWFDQESIATGVDFQQEIYRGIESSDIFLFVLSPQSIKSPYCANEVEYANGLNKRMVAVLHRPIDTNDLHPILAKLQWLDFRDHDSDFQANFQNLLRTLDTNREHLETHTRLLVRAVEWDRRERDESLLLRGNDLATAEQWLELNGNIDPKPTGLQQEYIRASRARQEAQEVATRKLRRGQQTGLLAAAAGIFVAAISFWFAQARISQANLQVDDANEKLEEANQQKEEANQEVSQAKQEVSQAKQEVASTKQEIIAAEIKAQQREQQAAEAVEKAKQDLEAAQSERQQAKTELDKITQESQASLAQFEKEFKEAQNRLDTAKAQEDLAKENLILARRGSRLERAGNTLLRQARTASDTQNIRLLISAVKIGRELEDLTRDLSLSDYPATSPVVLLQTILNQSTPRSRSFSISSTGEAIEDLPNPEVALTAVRFSADGTYLATANQEGNIQILNQTSNIIEEIEICPNNNNRQNSNVCTISRLELSPNGDYIATLGNDGVIRLWSQRGDEVSSIGDSQTAELLTDFTFSQSGQLVALKDGAGNVKIYDWSWNTLQINQLQGIISLESDRVGSMAFSLDETALAVTNSAGEIQLRTFNNEIGAKDIFETYQDQIRRIAISSDAERIATVDFDGNVRVWNSTGQPLSNFNKLQGERAVDISFSQDGRQLAIAYSGIEAGQGSQIRVRNVMNLTPLIVESCQYLSEFEREYPDIVQVCRPYSNTEN